ncbi:PaaI family thioesterase [Rhodohalobacter sp. 8-1]|uniref:PaaI family thioesterase n=1 Tax=Rhodohalobacter sp. 8-1 TaxID=3131972 RepID=UPI0030EED20C
MNNTHSTQYKDIVDKLLSQDPFSNWMKIEIIEVYEGFCTARCRVREDMINGFGVTHGGIIYSLADSALAFSAATGGRVALALNNSISYTKKARLGDTLTARSEAINMTHRTGLFDIKVTNQASDIIAVMKGTVYRTKDVL